MANLVVREAVRRAGRPFEPTSEQALEPHARRAIKALPGAEEDVLALREAAGPFGVPDFMALVGGRKRLEARRRLGVAPLANEVDARIVASTQVSRGMKSDAIAERAAVPQRLVDARLPRLIRDGILIANPKRETLTRPVDMQPLGAIYAVEMKVADWRRGLRQCRRYLVWADSYVLVMGRVSSESLDVLTREVARDRAGLVCDGVTIRLPSRVSASVPGRRLLASEYLVAALG